MRTIRRDVVGGFIFSSDGQLLMGKGGVYAGCWLVPGGGVKQGETKLEALLREIMEETGLDIANEDITQLEDVMTGESEKVLRDSGEKVRVAMRFYNFVVMLTSPAGSIKVTAEDDFVDARWFPVTDLPHIRLSPPSIVTLKKLGYL